jgi:microcystin-dependent protein
MNEVWSFFPRFTVTNATKMMSMYRDNANVAIVLDGIQRSVQHLNYIIGTMNLHIGEYKMSTRSDDFGGWLICDGRSLDRTTYSELYAVIGTSFGSSCGNTFRLPDARGRGVGMVGHGAGLTNRTLGDVLGEETHTLTTTEMPSHTHTGTTSANGAHSHTTNAIGGQGAPGLAVADGTNTVVDVDGSSGELNVWTTPVALVIGSNTNHTHTFTSDATGSGGSHNNMQPTVFGANLFIFAGIDYSNTLPA